MIESSNLPFVSVIIRNRNEGKSLRPVLESIRQQQLVRTEVVFVDNDSTDDSLIIATEYACRIVTLARDSFTYGRALNIGVTEATNEICVLLSAHSMLVGPYALLACVRAFNDPKVAAVRFLHSGKRFDILNWIEPEEISDTSDMNTLVSKGPLANGCAIRRSVWEKIRFNETVAAAEDKIWALEVVRNGFSIISPVATTYCYLKTFSEKDRIKKNNIELLAIFSASGVRLGHLSDGLATKLIGFVRQFIFAPVWEIYRTTSKTYLETMALLALYRLRRRK